MQHPDHMNSTATFLLEHNRTQSALFTSPTEVAARMSYRAQHPTHIAVVKCMDGRVHVPVITKTALGLITALRNIGGKFKLGWPYAGHVFQGWAEEALRSTRHGNAYSYGNGKGLVLSTYHYSKGNNEHRGCAGHNYDLPKAKAWARQLCEGRGSIPALFDTSGRHLAAVMVGVETDWDTMVFHGKDDRTASMFDLIEKDDRHVVDALSSLYPKMDQAMFNDLLPLALGNVEHIREIVDAKRPIEDAEHKETIIAVGRGFPWLHRHNEALIVGPYSPNIEAPIATAGKVVLGNITSKRIDPTKGLVLMSSALYRSTDGGFDHSIAQAKARELADIAYEAIKATTPQLLEYMDTLVGVTRDDTWRFEQFEHDAQAA